MKRTAPKIIFRIVFFAIVFFGAWFFANLSVHAVQGDTFGLSQVEQNTDLGGEDIRIIIGRIIRAVLGLLGVVALGLVLYAGFTIMTAGGNEEKVATGKKILINAAIGLTIILSSLAIVQFVLSRLSEATGSGSVGNVPVACQELAYAATHVAECSQKPSNFDCLQNPAWCAEHDTNGDKFIVRSVTPRGAAIDANDLVVRAVFSRAVVSPAENILMIERDEVNVTNQFSFSKTAGNFVIEGTIKREFSTCGDSLCAPKGAYRVSVLFGNVQDAAGNTVDSGFVQTRTAVFVINTDNALDAQAPEIPSFTVNGFTTEVVNAARGNSFPVAAAIIDDRGVGYVRLAVTKDGGPELMSVVYGPINTSNATPQNPYVFTYPLLLPVNLALQDIYTVSVTAYDIDHKSLSVSKKIVIIGETCNDGVQNGGETGVDSGGSCQSDTTCTTDAQCRSGVCNVARGICVPRPQITNITPAWDGAPGNWITIEGMYFGAQLGLVEFGYDTNNSQTIDAGDTWVPVPYPSCSGVPTWNESYIIVEVPQEDPAILARIQDNNQLKNKRAIRITKHRVALTDPILQDSSVDNIGPRGGGSNGFFTINEERRPGLCSVVTATGEAAGTGKVAVTAVGRSFGTVAGAGNITFGGQVAEKTSWTDTVIGAKVPNNMTPGKLAVEVTVDGKKSNGVPFTILGAEDSTLPDVQSVTPSPATRGSFITITGQRFGSSGTVYLAPRAGIKCATAEEGCRTLISLPATCGASNWKTDQIILQVASSTPGGTYFVVVKNDLNAFSNGQEQLVVDAEGAPLPSICLLDPSSGPAPRPESDPAVRIIGANFGATPIVFFSKRGNNPADLNTWFRTSTFISASPDEIKTVLPRDAQGFSLPVGPSYIKVQAGNRVSNSITYTVEDCTKSTLSLPVGSQCCATGPDLGQIKNGGEVCAGEKRTAGYVWRFTTGRIPRIPYVMEACNTADWQKQGVQIDFPSPTPWIGHASGGAACLNSAIALRFSVPMDTDTLAAADVKVFTCPTANNGSADCDRKQPVDESQLLRRYVSQVLIIRGTPPAPNLLPDTWYHIELSNRVRSAEPVVLLGRNQTINQPLLESRPCGNGTSYCFDFKTAKLTDNFGASVPGECRLHDANVEPAQYTTRLLGSVNNPPESSDPYYYYVWGRGSQACSALNVDGLGWSWRSGDVAKATVTGISRLGTTSTYATVEALQDTMPGSVKVVAETPGETSMVNVSVTSTVEKTVDVTTEQQVPVITDLLREAGKTPLKLNVLGDVKQIPHRAEYDFLNDTTITIRYALDPLVATDYRQGRADRYLLTSSRYAIFVVDLQGRNGAPNQRGFAFYLLNSDRGLEANLTHVIPESEWQETETYTIQKRGNTVRLLLGTKEVGSVQIVPHKLPNPAELTLGAQNGGNLLRGVISNFKFETSELRTIVTQKQVSEEKTSLVPTILKTNNFIASSTLTIDLGDPYVKEVWPNCAEACTNAIIGIRFSRHMKQSTYASGVKLHKCVDEQCVSFVGAPITIAEVDKDAFTYRFKPTADLETNTWYMVTAANSILSLGQLNPERDGKPLAQFAGSKFKTKNTPCDVTSVRVYPYQFTATEINQKSRYIAFPYGAPDACSPSGQELDPWSYGWKWQSDVPDVATVSQFESLGDLPKYCSTSCIPLGSGIERSQVLPPVCGDGIVDRNRGEDCDIAELGANNQLVENPGRSCSYSCLRPGNLARGTGALQCGNGTVDPSVGEECEVGVGGATATTCTSQCLNAGSLPVLQVDRNAPLCGHGSILVTPGEDCDIGIAGTEGCSNQCLRVGSQLAQSWCDSQSSSEIKQAAGCAAAVSVCGNRKIETGEECEVGIHGATNVECSNRCMLQNVCGKDLAQCEAGTDGCSADCRLLGSSPIYAVSSLCGDGVAGSGEYAGSVVPNDGYSCEIAVPADRQSRGSNPIQVVTAIGNGPVERVTQSQKTQIKAETAGKQGSGDYTLQCGYTEFSFASTTADTVYNDCPRSNGGVDFGVASNSCCYPRAKRVSEYPVDGSGVAGIASPLSTLITKIQELKSLYQNSYTRAQTYLFSPGGLDFPQMHQKFSIWADAVDTYIHVSPDKATEEQLLAVRDAASELFSTLEDFGPTIDSANLTQNGESVRAEIIAKLDEVKAEFARASVTLTFIPSTEMAGIQAAIDAIDNALNANNYHPVKFGVAQSFKVFYDTALIHDQTMGTATLANPGQGTVATQSAAVTAARSNFTEVTNAYKREPAPVSFAQLERTLDVVEASYAARYPVGAVCRNTYIDVQFDGYIEKESLYNNVIIATGHQRGFSCARANRVDVSTLVNQSFGTLAAADTQPHGLFARIWHAIKNFFARLFGTAAFASKFTVNSFPVWCSGSVSAIPDVRYPRINTTTWHTVVTLALDKPLDENSFYAVVLNGENGGIRDHRGVGIRNPISGTLIDSWLFKTGRDICKLEEVTVEPSTHLFSRPNTTTEFIAYAKSKNNLIVPIAGQYDWVWSWAPQGHPVFTIPAVDAPTNTARTFIAVKAVEGKTTAVAAARVVSSTDRVDVGTVFTGTTELTAMFCERPWPSRNNFPYRDTDYNFSMSYCADAGVSGSATDDLPLLIENPVNTVARGEDVADDILKKIFFVNDKNDDVFGIQVVSSSYNSVQEWYEKNPRKFKNASQFKPTSVAGYEALTDGSTYYVNALNEVTEAGEKKIISNIYVFSINADAQPGTREMFDKIVQSIQFNTNITNFGYCLLAGGDLHVDPARISSTACSDDFSCLDPNGAPLTDLSGVCSNAKVKFHNDWDRLRDIHNVQDRFQTYYTSHGNKYPSLDSGSFIPHYSAAYWSVSWGSLSTAIGGMPADPVNKKTTCGDASADPQTCWNAVSSTYSCPTYSSLYEYNYSPDANDYKLYGKLEYFSPTSKLVRDRIDLTHFSLTPWCQPSARHSPYTSASRCGDGVVSPLPDGKTEECDPPGEISLSRTGMVGTRLVNGRCDFKESDISCVNGEDCRYLAVDTRQNLRLPFTGVEKICSVFDPSADIGKRGTGTYYPLYSVASGSNEASFVSCSNDSGCQPDAYRNQRMNLLGADFSLNPSEIRAHFVNGEGIRYQCIPLTHRQIADYSSIEIKTADCNGAQEGVVGQCAVGTVATKRCLPNCSFSYSQCASTNRCGNGIVEAPEVCDDGAQNGKVGHCLGGNLACTGFDASCGNNAVDAGEFCEKAQAKFVPGFCNNVFAPQCNGATGSWFQTAIATPKHIQDIDSNSAHEGVLLSANDSQGAVLKTNDDKVWKELSVGGLNASQYLTRLHITYGDSIKAIGRSSTAGGKSFFTNSRDGGVTWSAPFEVDDILTDIYFDGGINGWAVGHPTGANGENKGVVWRTGDGGDTWNKVSLLQPVAEFGRALKKVFFVSSRIGWALGSDVVLKTTDKGDHWEAWDENGLPDRYIADNQHLEAMYFLNENVGFVVGAGSTGVGSHIIRTANGGTSWSTVFEGNRASEGIVTLRDIAFDKQNQNIGIAVGDAGMIVKTVDGGLTWKRETTPTQKRLTTITFSDENKIWVGGEDGTLLTTVADCAVRTCAVDADCGGISGSCVSANNSEYDLSRNNSCSWDCRAPGGYCGDGIPQPPEQCDGGSNCTAFCQTKVAASTVEVQTVAGTCDDGVVQTPNSNGVNEVCDLAAQNGVRCNPEYGKSCTYCSTDCREVLTVDPTNYCGDGKIDRIGGTDARPVIEACDVRPGNVVVSSTPQIGNALASEVPQCPALNQGGFTCNSTCTQLIRSCVFCGVSENKGAVPKIAVLNVLTPSSTLPNEAWGRQTWKELYRAGTTPPQRITFTAPNNTTYYLKSDWRKLTADEEARVPETDFRRYMSQQWVFLASRFNDGFLSLSPSDPTIMRSAGGSFFGLETNPLCRDIYKIAFNTNRINDPLVDQITPGSLFDYPVNGEGTKIENELVISPVVPEETFRVVVRWPIDEKNIKLSVGVYNQGFNTSTLTYEKAFIDNALCISMRQLTGALKYWVPDCAGFENETVKFSDIGRLQKTGAQAVTINTKFISTNLTTSDSYAVFVQGLNGPIAQYKDLLGDKDIIVDLYQTLDDTDIVPEYSIMQPIRSFSFKAAALTSSNPRARYWHLFNLVHRTSLTYFVEDSATGLNGTLETGSNDVICNIPTDECPLPPAENE